jgi:hypothetical protein
MLSNQRNPFLAFSSILKITLNFLALYWVMSFLRQFYSCYAKIIYIYIFLIDHISV